MTKKPHGGPRTGSGRKPIPGHLKRVKINLVVAPGTAAWIKTEAERRGVPQGRWVDSVVKYMQE